MEEPWASTFAERAFDEEVILESAADQEEEESKAEDYLALHSRLSCQLVLGEEHQGLLLRLPDLLVNMMLLSLVRNILIF